MSRPIAKLLPRHTNSMLASVLILISILLVVMAIGTPTASAKTLCTLPNRAGENSARMLQSRPIQMAQSLELQREKSIGRYNDASGCTLAAENGPGLIHLTDDPGFAGITRDNAIVGRNGIFAVPGSVADESTAIKVLRTGLPLSKTGNFVQIPDAASKGFLSSTSRFPDRAMNQNRTSKGHRQFA